MFTGVSLCGIAVAIDWGDGASETVRRLIAGMLHRGDVTDPLITIGRDIAMCTRRLRIVDAPRGVQPQASFDERYLVSFNGEIYNHAALRGELEAAGVRFRTECDTEVVANALRVWGSAGIKRLSGMYAFVAVDTASGEFLAARDPFGVKPLYLIRSGSGFLFCSEMRPLLEASEGDVLLLPPGFMLTRNYCGRHYVLPAATGANAASIPELDRRLAASVRARMPTNLPVAALYSGGIDSTLVVHYARQHDHAVSGYIAVGRNAPDFTFAKRYADATGFDLREVPVQPHGKETLSLIEAVVNVVESFEPAVIRPSLYTHLVSERIHRDGFRVALCGEGADELFAGYEPLEQAFAQSGAAGRHFQEQCLNLMHRANLQRVDRCSMRFQLEIREPFLDQTIVSYARGLVESALIEPGGNGPVGKAPLRALYDMYPAELPGFIRDRQKLPFHEGASGVDESEWVELFEMSISNADFYDGRREFSEFAVTTKEELFLIRALAAKMNLKRIPHLRGRFGLTCSAPRNGSVTMNLRQQPKRERKRRSGHEPRRRRFPNNGARVSGGSSQPSVSQR